jgi:hypothetical protein
MLRRCLLASVCGVLMAGAVEAQDAAALRARHAALQEKLAASPFGRPLHVDSSVAGSTHKGEIHAAVEHPYDVVASSLRHPAQWCEILLLQVNIKRCTAGETLSAFITRKPRDSVDSAHQVDFRYAVGAASPEYLQITLTSAAGPMGMRDYEIRLEAARLDARRTFLYMSYSYALGAMGRMAMDTYLSTTGRDKVGFSIVDRQSDGKPVYIDGVRGVVERTAMRYYLAIEAYLDSLAAPQPQRVEKRLRTWYAAISRHPQLREPLSAEEYVAMKRPILGSHESETRPAARPGPGRRRRPWRGEKTESEEVGEEHRAKSRGGPHGHRRQIQHLEAPPEKGRLGKL